MLMIIGWSMSGVVLFVVLLGVSEPFILLETLFWVGVIMGLVGSLIIKGLAIFKWLRGGR